MLKILTPEFIQMVRQDRTENNLTLADIITKYGVSKGTAYEAIKGMPRLHRAPTGVVANCYTGTRTPSVSSVLPEWQGLSKRRRGLIAEAAVQFQLVLRGFDVYVSAFDGDVSDFLVTHPAHPAPSKIQVKWPKNLNGCRHGAPVVTTTRFEGHAGRRAYRGDELDFLIAYDITTNTSHVWTFAEVDGRGTISFSPSSLEAWDKLLRA